MGLLPAYVRNPLAARPVNAKLLLTGVADREQVVSTSGKERYSTAAFFEPDFDVRVSPCRFAADPSFVHQPAYAALLRDHTTLRCGTRTHDITSCEKFGFAST